MANNYVKKCSTSLATRKMQIKTTRRSQVRPIRMAITKKKKKKTKKQVLPRMGIGQRKEPLYLVGIATMEISMEAPPKGRKNRTI
jgi:hypothetical protein